MILDDLISRYDEMPRSETMPLEEQPFHYLNWVIAKSCLTIDVNYVCNHKSDILSIPSFDIYM